MTITLEWWWCVPVGLVLLGIFFAALARDEEPIWWFSIWAAAVLVGHYL